MENAAWELARNNIVAVVAYANSIFSDLSKMLPSGDVSSTQYALANPGSEYLIVQPANGPFSVEMEAGAYNYEWFDPSTASTVDTGVVSSIAGTNTFMPPFSGSAVLYLKSPSQTAAASLSEDDSSIPDIDGARAIPAAGQ